MIIVKHELRQGKISFAVWTGAIGLLMIICIFLFPEIEGEMGAAGDLFASMGSFTAAFGMDKLNIGTLIGFYAIECDNIVGLGGAFFASLIGIGALSKEEKERTAEFLLVHPITRKRVITEKLTGVMVQILAMNVILLGLSLLAIVIIGEEIPWKEFLLIHLACFLLQVEIAGVCFGISSFLRRGSMGIGLGLAAVLYFLNLIANMTESVEFLKYITPFGYCEAADIVTTGELDGGLIAVGAIFTIVGIAAAYGVYSKKDIQ